jgi:four helix bundle protein
MDIFERTKKFLVEEKFSFADQIRRIPCSDAANFVETYRRRKNKAHFLSKHTDSSTVTAENEVWLNFYRDCKYLAAEEHENFRFETMLWIKCPGL